MPAALAHSHRPTTKVAHKPFKSKAASKNELRDRAKGRVPNEKGTRKTPHQQVMSKLDRRNQAKQARLTKHKEHLKDTSIFTGREGAPRIVAVLPLCPDGDATAAIKQLNGSLDIDIPNNVQPGNFRVPVDRFKQKLQYMPLKRDLTECLDAARVADFVVVVLSATAEVDPLGELILRSVESQGLSTLFTVCQGLDKIEPSKQRPGVVSSLKSFITHFHPEQEKVFSLDNRQECANLMRSLCNTTPKGVRWRDDRSWMLAEDIQFAKTDAESTIITGVVRGRGLKADRLVQVGDWGTFQIEKIVAAPLTTHKGNATQSSEGELNRILDEPSNDHDDLNDLAPVDVVMDDEAEENSVETIKKGVLLDDHHYFSEEEEKEEQIKKRVPRGTSNYQSAWYLENVSDSESESDMEDMEMEDSHAVKYEAAPEDGAEGYSRPGTVAEPSEYPQSEMMEDLEEAADAEQLAQYRSKKRDEAEDDKEFPDEVELHPQVLARERLSRYRGLKSLRTSVWQQSEDRAHEPENWRHLLQIPNYASSKARATHEALAGGVEPGTRVQVFVKGVDPSLAHKSRKAGAPVTLFSLFRHEHKKTAVNYLFHLSADHGRSIKSKEELIVQCGPRRMVVNPLFSQPGTTPNDVHKYARFLHPGGTAVATFTGPVTWGAVPVLFFRRTTTPVPSPPSSEEAGEDGQDGQGGGSGGGIDPGLALVGTGTALPPSTSRVVAKRVILTGHPYHIGKKVVVVRYMFFNRADVEWFKAMPLWTRRGRRGYVKEALGTRGYFKATFDGRINPQDSVGISLYKRVWPRVAKPLDQPLLDASAAAAVSGHEEVDGDLEMA